MADYKKFQSVLLGDIIDFKNGKSAKGLLSGNYPIYGANGIIGYCDQYRDKNTLIIGRVGVYCGSVAFCPTRFWASDNTIIAYPKNGKLDTKFAYYLLKDLNLNNYAGGAAQPLLTQTFIIKIPAKIPSLPTQQKIAAILSAYDDLIENNTRRIKILEEMAQGLYREWFVEFHFPEYEDVTMVEADNGRMMPEGWKVGKLSDVCENIYSGGTPNTKNLEYWDGNIPWLSSGETRNRFIITTNKTITTRGVSNSSTRLAREGMTLIASAGQGHTRGQTSLLMIDSYINQSIVALIADSEIISNLYLFFELSRRYQELRRLSDSHSSRGSLTTKLLAQLDVVIPPKKIVDEFDIITTGIVKLITKRMTQNINLRHTRDLLLPRLIEGEIDVSELIIPV